MFKSILCTLLLLLGSFAFAEDSWVTVDGYAPFSSGKLLARRQALVEAYRQAISAGGIVEVKGYSQMSNFSMIADVVNTRIHGYIKRYEVLSEGMDLQDKTLYKITIKAQIVNAPDSGDEQGLTSFLGLIGVPKVLFLISETDTPNASPIESYMAEDFKDVGYDVLTADDINLKGNITPQLIASARAGNGQDAAMVARSINADIVITGKLGVEMNKMDGGTDVVASIGNVSLNVKAIIPGNGKVVDIVNARDRFMSVQQSSELIAKEKALSQTAQQVSEKMKWTIPKYLSKQPRSMSLHLSHLPFEEIENVNHYLTNLAGIDSVDLDKWNDNVGWFTVNSSYTGPKERDLISLIKARFQESKVTAFSNYQIEMTL